MTTPTPILRHPVVLHVDVDSFEIQCLKQDVDLSKDIVAVNSNAFVLSATQSARKLPGIARRRTLDLPDIRRRYPQLEILVLPDDRWGKPDSSWKRIKSYNMMKLVLVYAKQMKAEPFVIQWGSPDEMFLDVSELAARLIEARSQGKGGGGDGQFAKWFLPPRVGTRTFVEWGESGEDNTDFERLVEMGAAISIPETHLLMGAIIAQEVANIILCAGSKVSVGVSTTKNLAKLATTMHRPRGITVLIPNAMERVAKVIKASKVTGMGGDGGTALLEALGEDLTLAELQALDFERLVEFLGAENAPKVRDRALGIETEPWRHQTMQNGLTCGRTVSGSDNHKVGEIIEQLCHEMVKRNLEEEAVFYERIGERFKLELEAEDPADRCWSVTVDFNDEELRALGSWMHLNFKLQMELMRKGYRREGSYKHVAVSVAK